MDFESIRSRFARRAIVMEIGGFRPPESPSASWFGGVNLALPGEAWPTWNGGPMHALCQLNLLELPFRPPRLDDIELIAVFIDPDELPSDEPNGKKWCLRAYQDVSQLAPLDKPDLASSIKPFPMRPRVVEEDYPCYEDVPWELLETYGEYLSSLPKADGFKLGGWPTLIQAEIFWAPWNRHPAEPEYVFQIDSTAKGHWAWGEGGVGYFGRGTRAGYRDKWTLAWQCY